MIGAVLVFVVALGFAVCCSYSGVLVYAHRERIATAFDIFRGRIALEKIENGLKFKCAREHPEPGYVVIKETDYKRLVRASNELSIARGFIGDVEAIRGKTTYSEVVADVLGDGPSS